MTRKTIHLITQRNWQAEELQAKGWETKHSLGLEIPNHDSKDAWWFPQAVAVRFNNSLRHHGLSEIDLTAPDSELLPRTPRQHSGRRVGSVTVFDALNSIVEWPDNLWWKMATAKNDNFPCQPLNHDELVSLLEELALPYDSVLQYSEPLPVVLSEHRYFIADRKVKARSGYLDGGVIVYDGAVFKDDHLKAADERVQLLLDDESVELPRAFVVDVAVTVDGAFVLEYNPAWCSGWYDCEISGVLDVVRLSTNPTKKELKRWRYQPDEFLSRKKMVPLPLRGC